LTFDMLDHVKPHGGCVSLKCKAEVPQSVVYRLVFSNYWLMIGPSGRSTNGRVR
jgi:hypothetical protein